MTEFTNADNTGGYIIPDDAVPVFAPIFAAEGFLPVPSPIAVFLTPNPSGEPIQDIKASDIINMMAKMRGTWYDDAEPDAIVECEAAT